MLKPEYVHTRERHGDAWKCIYGNIVTTSALSAETCWRKHIKKLRKKGYDTMKIFGKEGAGCLLNYS